MNAPGAAGSPLDVEMLATIDPSHIVTGCAYGGVAGGRSLGRAWALALIAALCLLGGRMQAGRTLRRR